MNNRDIKKAHGFFSFRSVYLWMAIVFVLTVSAVVLFYASYFGSTFISKKREDWEFFVTYINNTISPIAIIFTLVLSVVSTFELRRQAIAEQAKTNRQSQLNDLQQLIDRRAELIDEHLAQLVYIKNVASLPFRYREVSRFDGLSFIRSEDKVDRLLFLDPEFRNELNAVQHFKELLEGLYALVECLKQFNSMVEYEYYYIDYYRTRYIQFVENFLVHQEMLFFTRVFHGDNASIPYIKKKDEIVLFIFGSEKTSHAKVSAD